MKEEEARVSGMIYDSSGEPFNKDRGHALPLCSLEEKMNLPASAQAAVSKPRELRRIGIVVPVFNEELSIGAFHQALQPILSELGCAVEILFVDDGSKDRTRAVIKELGAKDPRIRLIGFSRNFGKEAALSAAIDRIDADVVVPIDVDLQDPPELIIEFVRLWREGYDVVLGTRVNRGSDTTFKRTSARLFYRCFNVLARDKIPDNTGDFRLMDRRVVEALRRLPERNRFMKGLFAWVGFRSVSVPYVRRPRRHGDAKLRLLALWRLAIDGITSVSTDCRCAFGLTSASSLRAARSSWASGALSRR